MLRSGANRLGGSSVEHDTTTLHPLASDGDLTTLEIDYENLNPGFSISSVEHQGRTSEAVLNFRMPQTKEKVIGIWFRLLA